MAQRTRLPYRACDACARRRTIHARILERGAGGRGKRDEEDEEEYDEEIETENHVYTADSLTKARLLHNAEIWPKARVNEQASLHGAYMRLYRDALGVQQHDQEEKRITDTQVLCEAQMHDSCLSSVSSACTISGDSYNVDRISLKKHWTSYCTSAANGWKHPRRGSNNPRAAATWVNAQHDVGGLCRQMPQRMRDLVHVAKGGRLDK